MSIHEIHEGFVATHEIDQPWNVMLRVSLTSSFSENGSRVTHYHIQRVRPVITLGPARFLSSPCTIAIPRLHEASITVPHMTVRFGPVQQESSIVCSSKMTGNDGCRPIVNFPLAGLPLMHCLHSQA